ncbi:SLAC1 family transporter [Streptococcus loxodontisalivarius]|uniref:Exfoliative toxin A/B n=1 Tax=Streptococcus loxodontisalivarius TaxID=1349415 RepID=A0ABS2PRT4_9STRE|nr:C4-dicarboxylate ABC transporter [Streptococcus loxodontisalivarius]MBM7642732.1 exfoliative toxin A/B [Streptococcus loxodontisalivarius]
MKTLIKAIPLGISGLMLGLIALNNLFNQVVMGLGYPFLALAGLILLNLLVTLIGDQKRVRHELKSVLPLSSFGTFSMALLFLAGQGFLPLGLRLGLWGLGFCLHVTLIILFTIKILKHWTIDDFYPSWFIIYVGIAAASITGPALQLTSLSLITFYFSFISYLILMLAFLYRIFIFGKIAEPLRANLAIMAAPSSLLLLACHALQFSNQWIVSLVVASQFFYFLTIFLERKLPQQQFSPAWAALTFPSVSTALALKLSLERLELITPVTRGLLLAEGLLATGIVCYIALEFVLYIRKEENS